MEGEGEVRKLVKFRMRLKCSWIANNLMKDQMNERVGERKVREL